MQWKFSDLVNKELFSFHLFIQRRKTNFYRNLQQNSYLRTDMVREKEI